MKDYKVDTVAFLLNPCQQCTQAKREIPGKVSPMGNCRTAQNAHATPAGALKARFRMIYLRLVIKVGAAMRRDRRSPNIRAEQLFVEVGDLFSFKQKLMRRL